MNSWAIILPKQTFQDTSFKLREIFSHLGEPKKAAIATSSIAATYLVYKLIQSYREQEKLFPNFEGAGRFQDQRPIFKTTSCWLEFWRKVNPQNYAAGYCKYSVDKFLTICDLKLLKELFLTHGADSNGRTGGVRAHMGEEYQHGVLFRDAQSIKIIKIKILF